MWFDLQAIRNQWDQAAEAFQFPMLDDGYYYHAAQKLTVYRDMHRWAMLIELLQYNNHEYDLDGIFTVAYAFGNCLVPKSADDPEPSFFHFASEAEPDTFLEDKFGLTYLNPAIKTIQVKGAPLKVTLGPADYAAKGIVLKTEEQVAPWQFLRGLVPEHAHRFWVSAEDMAHRLPQDLPVMLTIDEWYHPNLAIGQMPSKSETFWQLSKVIAMGDSSFYEPSQPANTHWKNWPDGGSL
jgi:hypothetical protein